MEVLRCLEDNGILKEGDVDENKLLIDRRGLRETRDKSLTTSLRRYTIKYQEEFWMDIRFFGD